MNHPFGHGFIEAIYGDLVDDLLLFYPPYNLLVPILQRWFSISWFKNQNLLQ